MFGLHWVEEQEQVLRQIKLIAKSSAKILISFSRRNEGFYSAIEQTMNNPKELIHLKPPITRNVREGIGQNKTEW
ncbi:unnamed protein product [Didymodactylos carnosus]|uniref:Uncharacterized protein n=2 Tax=Didymodactylos carnosus TaxID=1234261 RepID=A0A8S2G2P8_9BILA|nr:unnamed protein product [Didymodactylos carnosus]CAF4427567.1 unnamed protein product [Didymodactylos carnosus]